VTVQVVLGTKHDILLWGRYGLQMIKKGRALRIREIDYVYQVIFAIEFLRRVGTGFTRFFRIYR
jgi:hypothetical protein